ncbi:MAG: hypothetical protein ACRC26_01970 [Bacteroidales bacterium]
MKVKELIEELSKLDPEKEIVISEQLSDESMRYRTEIVNHIMGKVAIIFYICEDDIDLNQVIRIYNKIEPEKKALNELMK